LSWISLIQPAYIDHKCLYFAWVHS
jgi:hypothetical protein